MKQMVCRLILVLAAVLGGAVWVGAYGASLEKDLSQLDAAIMQRARYVQMRQQAIERCRVVPGTYTTVTDLYQYNQRLYDEYLKFCSDSALAYARRCLVVARRSGLPQLVLMARADVALALVRRGEGIRAADSIALLGKPWHYSGELRWRMAALHLEYNMRYAVRYRDNGSIDRAALPDTLWRPYVSCLPADCWQRAYYTALFSQDAHLVPRLQTLLAHTSQPSPRAAMLALALSRCCQSYDEGQANHYMVLSAINDVQCATRDASSLLHVLAMPAIDKASRRSSVYARVCSENINAYKDTGRSLAMVAIHSDIAEGYERKMETTNGLLLVVIVLLVGAVLLAVGMVWSIRKRDRRQERMLMTMKGMNDRLRQMVDNEKAMQRQLRESNARLHDEIEQRNRNFMDVYRLVSEYINDVRAFNKGVFNLITAGKVDKARRELAAGGNTDSYLTHFYHHFDVAFLSSHPDFIDRMNALMRPDSQLSLQSPQTLTPELRIYALVSIGITDVPSIAVFLHYSAQTIYNYRLRMRRGARMEGKAFAEAVAAFYRQEGDGPAERGGRGGRGAARNT